MNHIAKTKFLTNLKAKIIVMPYFSILSIHMFRLIVWLCCYLHGCHFSCFSFPWQKLLVANFPWRRMNGVNTKFSWLVNAMPSCDLDRTTNFEDHSYTLFHQFLINPWMVLFKFSTFDWKFSLKINPSNTHSKALTEKIRWIDNWLKNSSLL